MASYFGRSLCANWTCEMIVCSHCRHLACGSPGEGLELNGSTPFGRQVRAAQICISWVCMKLSVLPPAYISERCISASRNIGEHSSGKAVIVRLRDVKAVFASCYTPGRVPDSRTIRKCVMSHIASVGIRIEIAPGRFGAFV